MIITVTELRKFITSDETDSGLEARLSALELLIRAYTNNNFQVRAFRSVAVAMGGNMIECKGVAPFRVGDTLQIGESEYNADILITVDDINGNTITTNEEIFEESGIIVTKVQYPADIKMGVINLLKWELENRGKVGVASESISRHSVSYYDMTGDNSTMGYPVSLLGFLDPYKKARFGQGVRA